MFAFCFGHSKIVQLLPSTGASLLKLQPNDVFDVSFTSDFSNSGCVTGASMRWQRVQGPSREDQQISGVTPTKRGWPRHHPLICVERIWAVVSVNQARRNDVLSCCESCKGIHTSSQSFAVPSIPDTKIPVLSRSLGVKNVHYYSHVESRWRQSIPFSPPTPQLLPSAASTYASDSQPTSSRNLL
jgi:hypothetical protein